MEALIDEEEYLNALYYEQYFGSLEDYYTELPFRYYDCEENEYDKRDTTSEEGKA